jgi:uncharacterized protein YecT (DUF1311 family)
VIRSAPSLSFWLVGLGLLLAGPASAQEPINCENAMTQAEMTQCANLDWLKADAELNMVYRSAIEKMTEMDAYLPEGLQGAVETLREAQRTWIPYRDKACDAYGFLARGGTMEPMLVYGCRADLTRDRIDELRQLDQGLGN